MESKNCSMCGRPIGIARLRAMPDTTICAKCITKDRDDIDDEWIDFLDDVESALSDIDTNVINKVRAVLKQKIKKIIENEKTVKNKEESLEQQIADFHKDIENREKSLNQQITDFYNDTQVIQHKDDIRLIRQQYENDMQLIQYRHKAIENNLNKEISKFMQNEYKLKQQINSLKLLIPNFIMDGKIELCINQQRKSQTSPDICGNMTINHFKYLDCNINIVLWKQIDGQNSFYVGYLNKGGIISHEHKIKLVRTNNQKTKGNILLDGIQYDVLVDIQKNTDSNPNSDKCVCGYIYFFSIND